MTNEAKLAPTKKLATWKKIAIGFVVLIGTCAVMGRNGKDGKGTSGSSASGVRVAEVTLSVDELMSAYKSNEVAADMKYKGKLLLLAGKVHGIRKDFTDDIVIDLEVKDSFASVAANMNKSEGEKAAALSKGQAVSVLCEGAGFILQTPHLKHCEIR